MAQGAAWLCQAQHFMIAARHRASAAIDGVIFVPFAQRVGMWSVQWAKFTISGRNHFFHLKVTENAVVTFACALIGKQAEKQKHVTKTDALISEVRLGRTALAEQAFASREHQIFMAKMISRNPAPCDLLDDLAESELIVGSDRPATGGDRQADRLAADYW